MLNKFKEYFPASSHYIVKQNSADEINSFFLQVLFQNTQSTHKKDIWGKVSQQIPDLGKMFGWVADHFPLLFLSESVVLEIAESICCRNNRLIADKNELEIARYLLNKMGILHLADRNPFFLSEGETKIVWLLCQWAKSPEYLIIGNLQNGLSNNKIDRIVDFLLSSNKIAMETNVINPTIILGCFNERNKCYQKIMSNSDWKFVKSWPLNLLME